MGKCIIMTGGMGGIDPNELTAYPEDVLKGKIAGVRGSDEPIIGMLELTGTAADSQVYAGQTYYNTDAKTKRTGTMQAMSGQVITPGAVQQTISCAGKYMTGNIVVKEVQKFAYKVGYSENRAQLNAAAQKWFGSSYLYYVSITNLGFTPVYFTVKKANTEGVFTWSSAWGTIQVDNIGSGIDVARNTCTLTSASFVVPVPLPGTYDYFITGYY